MLALCVCAQMGDAVKSTAALPLFEGERPKSSVVLDWLRDREAITRGRPASPHRWQHAALFAGIQGCHCAYCAYSCRWWDHRSGCALVVPGVFGVFRQGVLEGFQPCVVSDFNGSYVIAAQLVVAFLERTIEAVGWVHGILRLGNLLT